ncbi:MAG: GIY-YIG nuclease family protein [Calditrichaceae bacterium]
MYDVYILLSEKDKKRYIGCSGNLERRLSEHQAGLVKSTRNRRPLKLVYKETFPDKQAAMNREKFFKSGKGREFLNKKLTD